MESITLTATIQADRRLTLTLDLPDDMPIGEVEIVIRPTSRPSEPLNGELTRDEARQRLKAAGLLRTSGTSPDAQYVDEAERERLRHILDGQPPISEQIISEREDRV